MFASTASRLAGLVLVAALSGCSLIVNGTSQEVTFTSDPPGATFTVAGKTEKTPKKLELPKDDYRITFQRAGYKDSDYALQRQMSAWFFGSIAMGVIASSIDVITGAWKEFDTTAVHVVLTPLPGTIQEIPVSIASDPAGAEIFIDGVSYGRTPSNLKIPWRTDETGKSVELRLNGYRSITAALPRAEKSLHRVLEALPVQVTVKVFSKPEGAAVALDGVPKGRTPCSLDLAWKPGDAARTVELVLEGYKTEKRTLQRETREITLDFQETVEQIALPLKIEPKGAKVMVDGKPVADGAATVTLGWSVSTTKHVVTVSHPGYATKTLEVARPAAAKPLEVRLQPSLP